MAEPLGTDDIEDVVSSVRRLVSPEARPRPMSRDLGLDKLLLTPALRVVQEEQPQDTLVLTVRAPEAEVLAAAVPEVIAEPAAEIAKDLSEAHLHVVEGEWEDAFWSEPEPALAELALGAEEAQLVTPETSLWAVDAEDLPDLVPDPEFEPEIKPKAEPAAAPSFSQALADGPETLAGLTDADGNPVTVLDESALNEIVRVLIREELQGVLGERITHNVRKLVRAEINRALTARALD